MTPQTTAAVKGQAGGLALVRKHGREHMRNIGRMGGRPRSLTIDDISGNMVPAAPKQKKEESHGTGLKGLLGLWRKQEEILCRAQEAAGGKPGLGLGDSPEFLPVPCGPGCNRDSGSLLFDKGARK